jgi:hypothetical protein
VASYQYFGSKELFHTCGKAVEKMSAKTGRVASSKAFEQIDRAKAAPRAERA